MKESDGKKAGWAVHEEEQRQAWMRLTHLQRLRWLDGAKSFVRLAEQTRRRRLAAGKQQRAEE